MEVREGRWVPKKREKEGSEECVPLPKKKEDWWKGPDGRKEGWGKRKG